MAGLLKIARYIAGAWMRKSDGRLKVTSYIVVCAYFSAIRNVAKTQGG